MITDKLVELRNAKGVTQEDVAQSLSVSNKTISKWENGTSAPDLTMLAELAGYYGVTTDFLLGLSDDKRKSTKEEVLSCFAGLDRRESVLKAFEIARSIVPALYDTAPIEDISYDASGDSDDSMNNIYPTNGPRRCRNEISRRDFYQFDASSENGNIAVMMLRNKANFAWMNDPDKQKEIVKIFKFLSYEDALSALYFIHSTACSDSFTADYIARNTGISEERSVEILDELCTYAVCGCVTAHLTDGEIKVYKCFGDGVILSLISLAFERMCGTNSYNYCIGGRCKMIGGKNNEFVR